MWRAACASVARGSATRLLTVTSSSIGVVGGGAQRWASAVKLTNESSTKGQNMAAGRGPTQHRFKPSQVHVVPWPPFPTPCYGSTTLVECSSSTNGLNGHQCMYVHAYLHIHIHTSMQELGGQGENASVPETILPVLLPSWFEDPCGFLPSSSSSSSDPYFTCQDLTPVRGSASIYVPIITYPTAQLTPFRIYLT
ncbi:hypothetical protein F4810DRAFT_7060 [Camillea tinctor]|nr:hypothetical protein F4810DRAFT_7060 [Camillea tinctor]